MKIRQSQTILITGTSSGIGQTIATHLNTIGYNVIGTSRNPNPNAEIRQLKLDVTNEDLINDCIRTLKDEDITIDILINNAGIALAGTIEDTTIDEALNQMDTNYFGVVRMIKAFIPLMRENGVGKIINIGSLAGLFGLPFQGHYCASKYALEGLVESLRMELKPFNIKMCNINPSDFNTEITQHRKFAKTLSPHYTEQFNSTMKVYEEGEKDGPDPIKIAKLVEQLLDSKSSWKIRYVVGNFDQTRTVFLKRLLGSQIFEKLLLGYYKI